MSAADQRARTANLPTERIQELRDDLEAMTLDPRFKPMTPTTKKRNLDLVTIMDELLWRRKQDT